MVKPSLTNFNAGSVRIVPFGGCGEFGMNVTAYICEDRIYIVDCGISFPDSSKLGVETMFPDLDPWLEEFGGVYAYIITHGHEDHIGALPFMLKKWPGPIYTTAWTAALIESKLERRRIQLKYPIHRVRAGDRVECDDFSIEFFAFNHSIPDAHGLMIRCKEFNIFHTGDFKFDFTPVIEAPVNLDKLKSFGKEGVHLLLADSTNAHVPGYCPSENAVAEPMLKAFSLAKEAVIVTTFSSNFWRVKTILDACEKTGRRVVILGSGIDNVMRVASDMGLYKAPAGLIIDSGEVAHFPRSKICVIATGSQGEWRSALMKMAQGEHKQFSIGKDDLVVFSSRTIPGNERLIQYMMSLLERRGAKIFSARHDPLIHVSGHAFREELKDLLKSLRPKHFMPVHGTFSHLQSNSLIPAEVGLTATRSIVIENGDMIDVSKDKVIVANRIEIDNLYVDADSMVPLDYDTLRERLRIGELGLVVVTAAYDESEKELIKGFDVEVVGLKPLDDEPVQELVKKLRQSAKRGFSHSRSKKETQREQLEEAVRIEVRRELMQIFRKKPVVICRLLPV